MSNPSNPEKTDLTGQVAMVTGGGRGIGRSIALALAGVGAKVAVISRTTEEITETAMLIEDAGGRAFPITVDVTDASAIEQMVTAVTDSLGPIDLLVNNAAVTGPFAMTWETTDAAWWRCMDVNVRGPMLCSCAVLPAMIARQSGRIIAVASGAGLGPMPGASAYSVSKTALIRFCENLAIEAAAHGVQVFSIDPGLVRTVMSESALASETLGEQFRQYFAEELDVPPELAAALVLQIASGRLDRLSGCYLSVQDDLADLEAKAETIVQNDLHRLRLAL
jgi:NAD(P)-dependent dehydrogenase (short-subunit alcohol dehydrogenase family)